MADQSARLAALVQKVERFEDKLKDVCEDMEASGSRREKRFAEKITEAKENNDINRLVDNIKNAAFTIQAQKRSLDRTAQKTEDLETKVLDLETENQTLRNTGNGSSELRTERRKNQDLTNKNSTLERANRDLDTKVQRLERENRILTGQDATLDRTIRDLEAKVLRLERENRTLRQQARGQPTTPTTDFNVQWFQDQIDKLTKEKTDLEKTVTKLESKKDKYKKANEKLTEENNKLEKDKDKLITEKDTLKEKNDELFKKTDKSIWGSRNPNCRKCQRKENHNCGGTMKFK